MSLHRMLRAAAGRNSTPVANTDPQFNYVSMLLHGDGTNGSQNNTFVDSSTNNFTITRNGNPTQGSLSPYGSLWSNYFDSNTTYLSFPSNTASNLGSSNFTFECWYYPMHTTGDANLFWWNGDPSGNNGWAGLRLQFNTWNGRTVQLLCSESASTWNISVTTGTVYAPNTWYHVAVVRNGATVTAYLNGTSIASGNLSSASASLYGGTENLINNMVYPTGTRNSGGRANISNVRLVKGTALYTSNFTPPSAPLTAITNTALLTCQSNRFIDNSANNFTITRNGDVRVTKESPFLPTAAYSTSTVGGSGYFDGSGDYLTGSHPSMSGTWTVECWWYATTVSVQQTIVSFNSGSNAGINIWCNPSAQLVVDDGANPQSAFTGGTFTPNAWNHVAVVRNGTTTTGYINGVAVGSNAFTPGSVSAVSVGRYNGATFFYVYGYISNLRVVVGTAVYTAAFTPPTAPLTAITNTSLLLNFTNAGIFDNAAESNWETVGNAQISTSVKKYGTGSLYFDGSGDWIKSPISTVFGFGTGDFTIECWVNTTVGNTVIFDNRTVNGPGVFYISSSGAISYYDPSYPNRSGTSNCANGQWNHLAWCRASGTFRMFVNGVQEFSASIPSDFGSLRPAWVGADFNSGAAFNGYIDDFRITKGVARYTANFTPPTAAFPDQ